MSQDTVDLLIRELVRTRRQATDAEIDEIINRIATAAFFAGRRNIPKPLLDLVDYHGYARPERGDDLTFHWAKHVLGDEQWTPDTTPEEYFQMALNAVRHPESRLIVQNAASGHDTAVIIAATENVVPEERHGRRSGDELLVIYSASTGRILSAYMTDASSRLTARPSTVWLRR